MLETTVTNDADLTLAADFPDATRSQWRGLVDAVLKGGSFDTLVSHTADGIEIQPLYSRDAVTVLDEMPGQAPFTRGRRAVGTPDGAWGIRREQRHPDPAVANAQIIEDLERGATSIWLAVDIGGAGLVNGVVIGGFDDLDRSLDAVHLELVTIVVDAGARFAGAAGLLMELWDQRGIGGDQRQANFGADPLRCLASKGRLDQGLDQSLVELVELARQTTSWPSVRAIEIDTAPYADAGAGEAQELAVMTATGVSYLRAMTEAGMDIDAAAHQIGFTVSADADVFATIAKIRAARRIWAHTVMSAGGSESSAAPPISIRTSSRMMSRRDPWVNILRTTAACFAAGVGGASSVTVQPFDAAIGLPDDLARRIARNTQLLLQEEAHVGRVTDPAGGSYYLESLTDQFANRAWSVFQWIEASGSMSQVLSDGSLAAAISEVYRSRQADIASRTESLTGVSEFPDLDEVAVTRQPVDAGPFRAAAQGSDSAGGTADLPAPGVATLVDPLPVHRLAEDFEALRDTCDAIVEATGKRPAVFLANLGSIAEHTARATYARNFFGAGGIEAIGTTGFDDELSVAAAFRASGARLAVICGSDARYADRAGSTARALVAAGATRVYLAGNPGDRRAADEEAGVDEFVHVGVDVVASLRTACATLEANA